MSIEDAQGTAITACSGASLESQCGLARRVVDLSYWAYILCCRYVHVCRISEVFVMMNSTFKRCHKQLRRWRCGSSIDSINVL